MQNPFKSISEAVIFLVCGEWLSYEKFLEQYEQKGMCFGADVKLVPLQVLALYLHGFPWTETAISETTLCFEERIEWFKEKIKNAEEGNKPIFERELKTWEDKLILHRKVSVYSLKKVEALTKEGLAFYEQYRREKDEIQRGVWEKKLLPFGEVWESAHKPDKSGFKVGLIALERVVAELCKELNIGRGDLLHKVQQSSLVLQEAQSAIETAKQELINAARKQVVDIYGVHTKSNGNLEVVPIGFLARDNYKINFPNNPPDEFSIIHGENIPIGQFSKSLREIQGFGWKNLKVKFEQVEGLRNTKIHERDDGKFNAVSTHVVKRIKTQGRPKGSGSLSAKDEPLFEEMKLLKAQDPTLSDSAAAMKLMDKIAGAGTEESKIKRLVSKFKSTQRNSA